MIVPSYWAEAIERGTGDQRQITVRRFGWSDDSEAAAAAHAAARARDALAQALAGEQVASSERRVPYNGADGLPIREEVIERRGEAVVTRNAYGARCLNTPDVLFADVDFEDLPRGGRTPAWLPAIAGLVVATWAFKSLVVGALVGLALLAALRYVSTTRGASAERAMATVRRAAAGWLAKHPGWVLRIYRTPAGARLAVLHRTFDPLEPEATAFFAALHVDPVYAHMCRAQQCFRARLGPKPWRIGIFDHLRPRPGVWPITDGDQLARRQAWLARYEEQARHFAACRFVEEIGQGLDHARAAAVIRWHDEQSGALGDLPLA